MRWFGGMTAVVDQSHNLHHCSTTYLQYANQIGPNGSFDRHSNKLVTWGAAGSIGLGTGGLTLKAWSGSSTSVKYHWRFGASSSHWICGNDNSPIYSSKIFAGA